MKTTAYPISENSLNLQIHPVAILSGNMIHILYPDGEVEVTTEEEVNRGQTKIPLDKCLVWGYLEFF